MTVSKPQNAEYANGTFFLTIDDWAIHLKNAPFIKKYSDTILVMTDGVTPMAMSKECALPEFTNFVKPVVKLLNDNDKKLERPELLVRCLRTVSEKLRVMIKLSYGQLGCRRRDESDAKCISAQLLVFNSPSRKSGTTLFWRRRRRYPQTARNSRPGP